MKVNIYDFDGTIYDGDSSFDFYWFCVKRKKFLLFLLVPVFFSYLCYFLKIKKKREVKEKFFCFLTKFDDISEVVLSFWQQSEKKIKAFYRDQEKHDEDIIISASPEFLLRPICEKLKVKALIGSVVDVKTGKFLSENCKGEEKVKRLRQQFPSCTLQNVYTDSRSDDPLIQLSKCAYLVSKEKIVKIK